jgi:hypothetical protein
MLNLEEKTSTFDKSTVKNTFEKVWSKQINI